MRSPETMAPFWTDHLAAYFGLTTFHPVRSLPLNRGVAGDSHWVGFGGLARFSVFLG